VAHTIGARAIVAFTTTGSTALRVARERPECPVIGMTNEVTTARRLAVTWGVHAVVTTIAHSMTEAVSKGARGALTEGFAARGDEVVVTAGVPFGQPGTTNALRVAQVK
jgi:pyruvate kinase